MMWSPLRLCQHVNHQAVRDCKSDLIVFPLVDVDQGQRAARAGGAVSGGKKRKTKETASSAGAVAGQYCTVSRGLSIN